VPVPVRGTVCGEPVALSATLRLAELAPSVAGVKLTEMLQLAPPAKVVPHALVSPNAPALVPVTETEMLDRVPLPVFISTTTFDGELVVPTIWLPKATGFGSRDTAGLEAPLPLSEIVWVAPEVFRLLSVRIREPLMLPLAVGVKLMGRVQVALAARVPAVEEELLSSGQAVLPELFRLKFAEMAGLLPVPGMGRVSAAVPIFSNVTVCGLSLLVDPGAVVAKVRLGPVAIVNFTITLLAESAI